MSTCRPGLAAGPVETIGAPATPRMRELEERVDFTERLLARRPQAGALGGGEFGE